jgi:hypothetical protein
MHKTINLLKMKKLKLAIIAISLTNSLFVFAQKKVALHHNGTTQIFSGIQPLTDAYNAAQNGDTIYVPGGLYTIPTIEKRIALIGTGYFTDSTNATGRTQINGLTIDIGADKSYISGLYIVGNILMNGQAQIDSIEIHRNHITASIGYFNADINRPENQKSKGTLIYENRVNVITGENASHLRVFNNIIFNYVAGIKMNGWIRNNTFQLNPSSINITGINESLIENNFFAFGWSSVFNNTFHSNICNFDPTADLQNTYTNTYINQNPTSVFVNWQSPDNYIIDYHLLNPPAFTANNASQIGIFGGYYPFKVGGLPINPHIGTINIGTQTNSNGELPVQIRVTSQND